MCARSALRKREKVQNLKIRKDEMTMDIAKFLLYLGVRMQDLKNEEQETREAEEYAQADMCGARYDELKKVVDELEKIM